MATWRETSSGGPKGWRPSRVERGIMRAPLDVAVKVAWSFLGKPYIWGGDDPVAGFDCSGFVIEILRSVGLLPRDGDWSAATLATKFTATTEPKAGCLVFWQNAAGHIVHVEFCVTDELSIGAAGGGSATVSNFDAIKQNAYVKVRPFKGRPGIALYADPFTT